ncbi:hypothetical protein USB125703_01896 [Pseudoclavibacter triregionum]|nr:hypothetical protein USB125703_01896 [Pseudoclavibacter triregionum]
MSTAASSAPNLCRLPPADAPLPRSVGRLDLAVAGIIGLAMVSVFAAFGGPALLVTFVPGVLIAWGVLAHFHASGSALPDATTTLPVFMVALAWQGIHFAEEHQAGFAAAFPALYGGAPFSLDVFTWFNMASYAVFSLSSIASLVWERSPLYLPALFFAVYGAIGNAISHLVFAVLVGGYFPGLVTALGYLVIGPVLMRRMWPQLGWRGPALVAVAFCMLAVPLQFVLASR